jgi:hypothetical protein
MSQGRGVQLNICGDTRYCQKIEKQTKNKEIVDFWSAHLPCLEVHNETYVDFTKKTFDFVPFSIIGHSATV